MSTIGKKHLPRLVTPRLVLRLANAEDAGHVADYVRRNREHFVLAQPTRSRDYYTVMYWRTRIAANRQDFLNDKSCVFFVFNRRQKNEIVGHVQFSAVQRASAQSCYLGYGVDRDKEGHGYMVEAIGRAIQFAFKNMNLHRICANYMPTNVRSGRLLERLGFVVEGYARRYLRINGQWEDHILTTKINESWVEPPAETK